MKNIKISLFEFNKNIIVNLWKNVRIDILHIRFYQIPFSGSFFLLDIQEVSRKNGVDTYIIFDIFYLKQLASIVKEKLQKDLDEMLNFEIFESSQDKSAP